MVRASTVEREEGQGRGAGRGCLDVTPSPLSSQAPPVKLFHLISADNGVGAPFSSCLWSPSNPGASVVDRKEAKPGL